MTARAYTEEQAIAALKRVAKHWPKTLWIFAVDGNLCIMRCNSEGKRACTPSRVDMAALYSGDYGGSADPAYKLDEFDVPNDAGDW